MATANVKVLQLPESDFHAWLRANKSLGGSSIGAVLGLNSYQSAAQVWDRIMCRVPEEKSNKRMDRGTLLEPIIAQIYAEETGRALYKVERTKHGDPQFWWAHATPDFMITAPRDRPHNGVLEVKSLGMNTFKTTLDEGIDQSYYAQLQWYLWVMRKDWGAFACFNAEQWKLHQFDVEIDPSFVNGMIEAADNFWHDHVMTRKRPVDIAQGSTQPALVQPPAHVGTELTVLDTPELQRAMRSLKQAHEAKKLAEYQYKLARDTTLGLLDEVAQSKVMVPGVGKVVVTQSRNVSLDKDRLRADLPEGIDLASYETVTFSRSLTPTFT